MSKFDKCCICDYNEAEGSVLANVSPGTRGKVRKHSNIDGDYYCEECSHSIFEVVLATAFENEDETEGTTESFTLS